MTTYGEQTTQTASDTARGHDCKLPLAARRGLVKICGLRQTEHAVAAAGAGADLIGYIFAPARRQVSATVARSAIIAARAVNPEMLAVGVFVNAGAGEINEVAKAVDLDLVQLNGDEPPELLPHLVRPAIKAVKPPLGTAAAMVERQLEAFTSVDNAPVLFLIDGYLPGVAGGGGVRADWALARELAHSWPITLAGGLGPENVGEAVAMARPAGVDVSSGVEIEGVKDSARIAEFVANARAAFTRLAPPTA